MDLIGRKEWNQIFNIDLSKIWQEERQELQTAAVLMGALNFELKKVQNQVENELQKLRKKYKQKEELLDNIQRQPLSPLNTNAQKNENFTSEIKSKNTKENNFKSILESPDLFRPTELANISETIIDLSMSDEDDNCTSNSSPINIDKYAKSSPRLNKSKKPYHRLKKKLSQESYSNKLKDVKKDIFQVPHKSDADETFIDSFQVNKMMESKCKNNLDQGTTKIDSNNILNEIDELLNVPNKKQKFSRPEPEPIIKGNARKILMKGTTCKDCIDFYGSMDLPADQLQKIINQCSKHRYVHQPRDETMPGYWDLSFPDV